MSVKELANSELAAQREREARKQGEVIEVFSTQEKVQEMVGGQEYASGFVCGACGATKCILEPTGMRGGWVSSQMEEGMQAVCCVCSSKSDVF